MYNKPNDIASIISSRICHDLVSPLGAISNGLELMELRGAPRTQEFDLMSQSVTDANARIQFFRLAFGDPCAGSNVSEEEIQRVLGVTYAARRLNLEWAVVGEQPRPQIKLILLLIQCLESAMPLGGDVLVRKADSLWAISASNGELRTESNAWQKLLGNNVDSECEISPSEIHFELARAFIADMGLQPEWSAAPDRMKIVVETKFS